jgi:hypothetical protein
LDIRDSQEKHPETFYLHSDLNQKEENQRSTYNPQSMVLQSVIMGQSNANFDEEDDEQYDMFADHNVKDDSPRKV